jgi:hypothetical protein
MIRDQRILVQFSDKISTLQKFMLKEKIYELLVGITTDWLLTVCIVEMGDNTTGSS